MARKPVIGFVCDVLPMGGHTAHLVYEKYLYAVTVGADATPILIPGRISDADGNVAPGSLDIPAILDIVDGLFLPGSPSNLSPVHYGSTEAEQVLPADPHRDALSVDLIRAAMAAGIPMLGVCRGCQEMNAAFGGTLHGKVHEQTGYADHRVRPGLAVAEQYATVHDVALVPDSTLARWSGAEQWRVNSLHGQGVDRLAPGLVVEARAPDGLVEAFSHPAAKHFTMGIQWHPEWRFGADRLSTAIFREFGSAARDYASERVTAQKPAFAEA
jgi:putative glutamine amidotransferase